ncbi:hypothetical protein [Microbaculum marinum]|uniref:Uncharacterized protein n=1 Tax=Microbaculum marinum TaxID=1764581 RepID=A0AAW9RTC0_9HYPH
MNQKAERSAEIEAATIASLLTEYRDGRDPLVTYEHAAECLRALGRPLTPAQVRDLVVDVRTLGGRSVGRLCEFVQAADDRIERLLRRPNLKAQAAAAARAAKRTNSPDLGATEAA